MFEINPIYSPMAAYHSYEVLASVLRDIMPIGEEPHLPVAIYTEGATVKGISIGLSEPDKLIDI